MNPDWESDMMIFHRKIGEKIIIDNEIGITILGVHENNIRLGINEPKSISMPEKEIHLSMKKEQEKSDSSKKQARINNMAITKTIN